MAPSSQGGVAIGGAVREPWNQGQPFTLRDVLIAGFYHRRIIIFFALLPLLVGGIAVVETKTNYTASDLLMVLVNREFSGIQNVTDSGPAVLSIEGLKSVESEIQIIESAETIRTTITTIGLERIFPDTSVIEQIRSLFSRGDNPMDDAIARFRRNLSSSVQSGSNVIRVSFSNPDRAVAIEVMNELIRAYLDRRRVLFQNPTSGILAEEVRRLNDQLLNLDREIEAVKVAADMIDFAQDSVLAANQVDTIIQRRRQVEERVAGVAGQLTEAEKQKTALTETVFDFYQQSDAVANDDDRNLLTRLQTDRNRLTSLYPATSPAVREVDKKIATVREAMQSPDQKVSWTKREVRNPAVSFVANMILSLSVEQDSLKQQIAELDAQQEVAQKRLAVVRGAEAKLIELNRQRDVLTRFLSRVHQTGPGRQDRGDRLRRSGRERSRGAECVRFRDASKSAAAPGGRQPFCRVAVRCSRGSRGLRHAQRVHPTPGGGTDAANPPAGGVQRQRRCVRRGRQQICDGCLGFASAGRQGRRTAPEDPADHRPPRGCAISSVLGSLGAGDERRTRPPHAADRLCQSENDTRLCRRADGLIVSSYGNPGSLAGGCAGKFSSRGPAHLR